MQTSAFKFLPLILAALVVVGAVAFASQRLTAKKKIEGVFTKLPEPTPFVTVKPFRADTGGSVVITTPTPTPTPTLIPQTNESNQPNSTSPAVKKTVSLKTERSEPASGGKTVCTPVYGMANSCAEHVVVDTGLETSAFSTLAVLSYFGGLAAFIKAKKRA